MRKTKNVCVLNLIQINTDVLEKIAITRKFCMGGTHSKRDIKKTKTNKYLHLPVIYNYTVDSL